ncbi:anoctamin-8-like [Tubulanus polymorphus]|uniref:anoctamin-8-like n=1 Tax=Tubulanus polymorphus TaxID=672921 RepID=UPI003DA6AE33
METKDNTDVRQRKKTDATPSTSGGESTGIFGRKFASTSRFVVSSKVWMNTIPTRDCDVLLTFPAKTDDQTLMWVLARLRSRTPELEVHVRHHSNTGVYGFYMTSSYENLLKGAEEINLKKELKMEYGGGMKDFEYDDKEYYKYIEEERLFFTSQERQSIVKHMMHNLRAIQGDELNKVHFIEGQAIIPFLESRKIISRVLPLHNSEDLTKLKRTWVQAFFKRQPLDKICDYFGVKIGLYFAYLGHYTKALILPAFLGVMMWFSTGKDQEIDDLCFMLFALFNIGWATLYLEHWKRQSSAVAYRWGTLDRDPDLLVEPRPLFKGQLKVSPVSGRQEPYYPPWKRNLFRYLVSMPIIIICLMIVFASMLLIFQVDGYVTQKVKAGELWKIAKFGPKILLAITIGILDDIYKKIAFWLNDKENYREDSSYENHLIIKLVLFQFVNSFLSLFYIAFYLKDMNRLREQLAALLITRQVIGNIKEALVPYIIEKVKLFQVGYKMTANMSPDTLDREAKEILLKKQAERKGLIKEGIQETCDAVVASGLQDVNKEKVHLNAAHSGPTLTQAEVEAAMKPYEDTFEDYLEMFIQFGYVTLFSCAFPMAALCALTNNIIEIRSDAFKLCMTSQRPFGQRVADIGVWQDALELMGVIAVIVNSALIGMSGPVHRMFPNMGPTETVVFIVVLEHLVLAMKCGIAYAIPDIPHWVEQEMAKWEFRRREAFKRIQKKNSDRSQSHSRNNQSSNHSRTNTVPLDECARPVGTS